MLLVISGLSGIIPPWKTSNVSWTLALRTIACCTYRLVTYHRLFGMAMYVYNNTTVPNLICMSLFNKVENIEPHASFFRNCYRLTVFFVSDELHRLELYLSLHWP